MSTTHTILLLGSNLGDKLLNLSKAKKLLSEKVGLIIKEGEIIETKPVEFTSDKLFLNQLIMMQNPLSPIKLLNIVKEIERAMGRTYPTPLPNEQYTSRIIDIDILYMDDLKYKSARLNIPHNQIYTRGFVKLMLDKF